MADRTSRYRKSGRRTAVEPDGTLREYTAFRETPVVEGSFRHTVSDTDRLDHLAYTYYGKSRRWWRIADANPEAVTPFALLGDPARATVTLEFTPLDAGAFSFARLRTALDALPGVVDVHLAELLAGHSPANRTFPGEPGPSTVQIPQWRRSVTIDYYTRRTDLAALSAEVEAQGCTVTGVRRHERLGQRIVIPPDSKS